MLKVESGNWEKEKKEWKGLVVGCTRDTRVVAICSRWVCQTVDNLIPPHEAALQFAFIKSISQPSRAADGGGVVKIVKIEKIELTSHSEQIRVNQDISILQTWPRFCHKAKFHDTINTRDPFQWLTRLVRWAVTASRFAWFYEHSRQFFPLIHQTLSHSRTWDFRKCLWSDFLLDSRLKSLGFWAAALRTNTKDGTPILTKHHTEQHWRLARGATCLPTVRGATFQSRSVRMEGFFRAPGSCTVGWSKKALKRIFDFKYHPH